MIGARSVGRWGGLSLALLTAAALAGCGSGGSGSTAAGGTTLATRPVGTTARTPVTVYFADSEVRRMVPERHEIPAGGAPLRAALDELAQGPQAAGLLPALPQGTRVLSATSAGGTARVDLSQEFADGYPSGGSAAEIAMLAPLVYTATAVPGIRSVLLTVAGRTPDLPGSQYDLSAPLTRRDFPSLGAAP